MFLCRTQADLHMNGICEHQLDKMFPWVEDRIKAQLFIGLACASVCLISYSAAFSHGASLSACSDMTPRHIRAQPQNTKKNYISIHTNRTSYMPGDTVPVTIRSSRDFMGFLLQARRLSNDQVAGSFVFIPPGSKLLHCFEDGDTVTHSDKSLKRNLSFVWKSPDQPVGDIKFFVSVVQSYFVYWARLESVVVSSRILNRTLTSKVTTSKVIPTTAQSWTAEESSTYLLSVSGLTPTVTGANTIALTAVSTAGTKPSTNVSKSYKPMMSDQTTPAVPSLSNSNIIATIQPSQSHGQRQPSYNGTSDQPIDREQNIYGENKTLCLSCKEKKKVLSGFPLSPPRPTFPPDTKAWLTGQRVLPDPPRPHLQQELTDSLSPSTATNEEQTATKELSANFLQQPVDFASDENINVQAESTLSWVTRPVHEVVGKGGEENRGMQLAMTQLGILLGCAAVLGMALAAGLRCIHAQYCHKRTEVSFSEPDNNLITVTENGEMMQFRKIRENSFVLVQAEYNWITPAGGGKTQ
ncbi:reelin domain-containing protein 1-like [Xenopus laevis]|uniref:Reelin domain-containing protein 1-like n=1 Tax=Xenopus laevis TaxID=8355 RepID=A0A8J0VLA1_XENLA|nr:reelin domain-containing protein 1-like [Xenopus laevis]